MSWTRMALRSSDERGKLNAVGARKGWIMDEIIQPSEDRPFEIVWVTEDGRTKISYIQDDVLGLDLFFARGEDHEECAENLREKADVISRKDALEFAERAKEGQELVQAAYIIAATGSCKFDKRVFEVIERIAEEDDPTGRHATVVAMGYLGWDELLPLLEKLREDENEDVREAAEIALKHWSS